MFQIKWTDPDRDQDVGNNDMLFYSKRGRVAGKIENEDLQKFNPESPIIMHNHPVHPHPYKIRD